MTVDDAADRPLLSADAARRLLPELTASMIGDDVPLSWDAPGSLWAATGRAGLRCEHCRRPAALALSHSDVICAAPGGPDSEHVNALRCYERWTLAAWSKPVPREAPLAEIVCRLAFEECRKALTGEPVEVSAGP